ncbi:uncharacterized protein LOC104906541 [Beta vulgaris subsp. vulgaris]|uniref:uncharacterized protein LOC104906541 n=1 Tax=Beta vulgaris subsp. vulgaris TaxID=3555 RepID=UPI002546B27A|nr:uncharacterized protein LOC104906541 [Beta vulgaris subsp. vulgaris]
MNRLFSEVECIELPFLGSGFTWKKKRSGPDNILERLDKGVANLDFLNVFPNVKVQHHAFTSSDHCQVSVKLDILQGRKSPPFRFDKAWTTRKDFEVIIKKAWSTRFHGSYMFCLTKKCKLLKEKAKNWATTRFGNVIRQLKVVESKLKCIQDNLLANPSCPFLAAKLDKFHLKQVRLLEFQELYWKTKAKSNHLKLSDSNTKYFHACASIRRNRNFISSIEDDVGVVLTDPKDVENCFTNSFVQRFTANQECFFDENCDFSLLDSIISEEDNMLLCSEVSAEEIKNAVFELAPDKAPGPDGFPPYFFQKYWSLVGNSVCHAVRAFFFSGTLLKEVNHTFITLIPKVESPSNPNQFRPISLCSTIYKVIAKIMASRLKIVLGKIIHPLQGAFVPERLIQDNVLIAHEVFHSFKKKSGNQGWLAIKLDMEEAYDRLEWNFIFAVFKKLGFCERWVGWMKECISSVSFSVLVNGIPGDVFYPSRGIRQGDPLSPYIFILCAEILARQLHAASREGPKLVGVSLGHSRVKIPFLTFADDTMIFAKAIVDSCTVIREILDDYCRMSGQLVNYNKSAYQCSPNTDPILATSFTSILRMGEACSLGTYLGCPIIDSKVTNNTFGDIQEKVQGQLSKWKANSLSQAGRTVLIQSNLATKANYQMQCFLLPPHIVEDLDKSYRNFFWNKSSESKSPNLIGWDRICKPKQNGGLGLRKAKVMNMALQFKLLWKILFCPDNLWVNLVSKKYMKSDGLFDYRVKANVSWQWRKLMSLRNKFKHGLRWVVGRGDKISFWFDNWVFQYPICSVCSVLRGSESLVVESFITQDYQWDAARLREFVKEEVCLAICSIFIPSHPLEDKCVWALSPDGCYSVNSGVQLIQGSGPEVHGSLPRVPFFWIWSLQVPPKIRFFLWKIWTRFGWPSLPGNPDGLAFIDWFCALPKSRSLTELAKIATTWWFVWYARNGISFREEAFPVVKICWMIKKFVDRCGDDPLVVDPSLPGSDSLRRASKLSRLNVAWVAPPVGFFKLNFDGSKLKDGSAALGFVIRNGEGMIKLCGARSLSADSSILVAEAWALREGLVGARMLGLISWWLKGQSVLIQAIKRVWKIPWSIHSLMDAGKIEEFCGGQYQPWSSGGNAAADWMAHRGHLCSNLTYWFESPDFNFSVIIRKDALGWPISWEPP